jgi:cytochrome c oxidase cbb3-type subunit 4
MDFDYQAMRTFADSWGLVYLMAIFLFVFVWIFRPGSQKHVDDAAQIPFKED